MTPCSISSERLQPIGRKFYILLTLWCGLLLGSTILEKQYYTREQYAPFKKLAQEIDSLNTRYSKDKIAHFISLNHPGYIHYYLPRQIDRDFYSYRYDDMKRIDTMFQTIRQLKEPYLLDVWSNIAHPDIIDPLIKLRYPRLVLGIPHFNAGLRLYARDTVNADVLPTAIYNIPVLGGKMETFTTKFRPELSGRIARLSGKFMLQGEPANMEWVLSVKGKEKDVFSWNTYRPEELDPAFKGWQDFVWYVKLPERQSAEDVLKIYIWEYKPEYLKVSGLRLEVY